MKTNHTFAHALFALAVALVSTRANAEVLGPGFSLAPGQRLNSSDGGFYATLTSDGNFSVLRTSDGAVAWSTATSGSGAIAVVMQREGRLALMNSAGMAVWTTPTRGRHRIFGVSKWGTAMVIDARRWKPRRKKAEPTVEQILRHRGRIHWQSNSFDKDPRWRERKG